MSGDAAPLSHRYRSNDARLGDHAWTGTEDNWLGGGAAMWWSHSDNTTYRAWITDAGLIIEQEHFVPEGADGHSLFWARRA